MKYFFRVIFLYIISVFEVLILVGCTNTEVRPIYTNEYVQKDYDYHCLDGTKTFTQIIVCYQTQDNAEKAQNKITNDLILQDQKDDSSK